MVFGQQLFQSIEWKIDGRPMEFEWKSFPGLTAMGILNHIQQMMGNYSVNQRTSQAGSSSCQCLSTLCGMQKEMINYVKNNSKTIEEYAERFPRGHWSFPGPGSEKKSYGTDDQKMDLGTELQIKKTAEFHRIRSCGFPSDQCFGERRYGCRITSWSESCGETKSNKSTTSSRRIASQ